jgi:hypothetical protein
MHIFAHIAEGKDTQELNGWGAVVWFQDEELNFVRFNMTDLHIVQLETGEFLWCSTYTPLTTAIKFSGAKIKQVFTIEDERNYFLRHEDGALTLFKSEKMVFGTRYKSTPMNNITYSGGVTWINGVRREWCKICKSMVCVHNGDDAYPSDDSWHERYFGGSGGRTVLPSVAQKPSTEVGKDQPPFEPSTSSTTASSASTAKPAGQNDSLTSSTHTKEIKVTTDLHSGSHSARKDKCGVKGCNRKVSYAKNQLICPQCYTAFDARLKNQGRPLVIW